MFDQSLSERHIDCPYCGEKITVLLDISAGEQDYYEDCSVCCRPIHLLQTVMPDGEYQLGIMREDES